MSELRRPARLHYAERRVRQRARGLFRWSGGSEARAPSSSARPRLRRRPSSSTTRSGPRSRSSRPRLSCRSPGIPPSEPRGSCARPVVRWPCCARRPVSSRCDTRTSSSGSRLARSGRLRSQVTRARRRRRDRRVGGGGSRRGLGLRVGVGRRGGRPRPGTVVRGRGGHPRGRGDRIGGARAMRAARPADSGSPGPRLRDLRAAPERGVRRGGRARRARRGARYPTVESR